MVYVSKYNSRLGKIFIASDGNFLTGLWFNGQKYFADNLPEEFEYKELEIFKLTKKWLDEYFSGEKPNFIPPISMENISSFRKRVLEIMLEIPYGQTSTYGKIAKQIENETGKRASAQAVGGAVGRNSISIIIPCHRVVGTNGSLTGYAGGIDKKIELLKIECVDVNKFTLP